MEFSFVFILLGLVALLGGGDDGGSADLGADDPNPGGRLEGTDGNDTLTGTEQNDLILGEAGDDALGGGNGDDAIDGGSGDDRIFGGAGNDVFAPQGGADSIFGGNGADLVFTDFLDENGISIDQIASGDDFIRGGAGEDTLADNRGANTIYGDGGADWLISLDSYPNTDGGADLLFGGQGFDQLTADDGDTLTGGPGGDLFENNIYNSTGPIYINDFDQSEGDLLQFSVDGAAPTDVEQRVMLNTGDGIPSVVEVSLGGTLLAVLEGTGPLDLNYIAVESTNGDFLTGSQLSGTVQYQGSNADEAIVGTLGNDVIEGRDGEDTLFGQRGNDGINGGLDSDRIFGGSGDDVILGDSGDDLVRGGDGDDSLFGGVGSDTIFGDKRNDFIDIADGGAPAGDFDEAFGGFEADTIVFDAGDEVTGGKGADTFRVLNATDGFAIATITDFNAAGTDTLILDAPGVSSSDIAVRIESDGAYVSFAGTDIVFLQGVTSLSVPEIVIES